MSAGARRREEARRASANGQRTAGPGRPAFLGLAAAGVLLAVALAFVAIRGQSGLLGLDQQVQRIASGMRCVACQNLSVADSPSDTARAMRVDIRQRVLHGQTPEEIRSYFVGRYGQWILLSPPASGVSLIAWIAPPLALLAGAALAWGMGRRRPDRSSREEARASEAERARIRQELALLEEPE